MVLGGGAPHTQLAPGASTALQGQPWSQDTLKAGLKALALDLNTVSQWTGLAEQAAACLRSVAGNLQVLLPGTRRCSCKILVQALDKHLLLEDSALNPCLGAGWQLGVHQAALASFFFRFFLQVSQHLPGMQRLFPEDHASGAAGLTPAGLPQGLQHYQKAPDSGLVGHERVHLAAQSQASPQGGPLFVGGCLTGWCCLHSMGKGWHIEGPRRPG